MGGVVSIPIVILLYHRDLETCLAKCRQHLFLTHKSERLFTFVSVYARILCRVLQHPTLLKPAELQDIIITECRKSQLPELQDIGKLAIKYSQRGDFRVDANVIGGQFSPACYIDESMPSLLYLAYKYADSLEEALVANTNVGGENCHRGAVLGALMGAAFGQSAIPLRFQTNLSCFQEISQEIDTFYNNLK